MAFEVSREQEAQQRLPETKPDYLSQADYEFILARDKHRCVYYGNCPRADGNACCDEVVEFDHEQPTELGGDDSVGNIRLLCRGPNRGRLVEPAKRWADQSFWDNAVSPGKLRQIQQLAGWDAIEDLEYLIRQPSHLRRVLLGSTTFIPGATGIGKAILCQSFFFKLNQVIGRGFPRAKNVLWLTTDTTLQHSTWKELETDGSAIEFIKHPGPTVQIAHGFAGISAGPNGADVKVATVQSLWKVEMHDGLRRTGAEIKAATMGYDTVVFDECDWANSQVQLLAQHLSHLLQVSISASPPYANPNFLARFVLISPTAIADYVRARDLDSCLKFLGEVTIAAPHEKYMDREKGTLRPQEGQMEPDHVLYRAAISEAVRHADQEETRMKAADPDSYYSGHIMVRMERKVDVRAMYADLKEQLRTMHDRGEIKNSGWDVSMIFDGHEKYVPNEEKELTARDRGGQYKHPFMLACNNRGTATERSKRILIMCDIGVRGINNWTISHIVDCTETMSTTELIQFNWGRPLRWRLREDWVHINSPKKEYATVYNFIPQSNFAEDKLAALEVAKTFVNDMLNIIGQAGFLTWQDLLEGRRVTDIDVNIDLTNRPLKDVEKFQIQKLVADAGWATGQPAPKCFADDPELVERAIGKLPYKDIPDRLRQKMLKYGRDLVEKPDFRKREIVASNIIEEFKQRPACVMEKLEPQETYDIEDLKRWVKNDPEYSELQDDYLHELATGVKTTIHSVSRRLRDTQIANYRPASRTRRLQGSRTIHGDDLGVLDEVAGELWGKLKTAGHDCNPGEVKSALNWAANFIFQISAENGGPMDHPAYHNAIQGRYRGKLQDLTRSKLMEWGVMGDGLRWFAST
jgi:hypothetical protein